MCYMCVNKENKCTIDCANNVGGYCKYIDFADKTECKPEECECQKDKS